MALSEVTQQGLIELIEYFGSEAGELHQTGEFHPNGAIQAYIDLLNQTVDHPQAE